MVRKDYFWVNDQIECIISEISVSKGLKKAHIRLKKYNAKINITDEQYEQLKAFYKGDKIAFTIRQKIKIDTEMLISTSLIKFEVLDNINFMQKINTLVQNEGDLFPNFKNGQEALLKSNN